MTEANIKYYIELDQLIDSSVGSAATQWYLHTDKVLHSGKNNDATDAVVAAFTTNDATFKQATPDEMPPSSFRGLFNELNISARKSVGAVVISNYDAGFINKNFESQYDAAQEFGFDKDTASNNTYVQQLCTLAQKVAATAVYFANEGVAPATAVGDAADCDYIVDLIKMIAVNRAYSAGDASAKIGSNYLATAADKPAAPLSRYVRQITIPPTFR